MAIRIQPREPDICEDDPFRYDLLNRRESVEVLTSIIGSIEGPCVLAVDAAWGTGKTTFLKMWSQHLTNSGFPVVQFNAWETDFAGDPFVALSSEIADGLEQFAQDSQKSRLEVFRAASRGLMRAMSGPLLRVATSAVPFAGPQIAKELKAVAASSEEDATSEYLGVKSAMEHFKEVLRDTAMALAESREGKPLVLMIDELDRCRPSYAIALLEGAKHLFMVDRVVFVLAVDRVQLAHSVKVLYGDTFDAEGYLRRFFDVDYRLPFPRRDDFIVAMLQTTGILSHLEEATEKPAQRPDEHPLVQQLLVHFFGREDLSLRAIARAIHRLSLVSTSLFGNKGVFAITAAVAVILRTIDSELYHRFVRNEVSDRDVVEEILGHPKGNIGSRESSAKAMFEAFIILAAIDNRTDNLGRFSAPHHSPLQQKYRELTNESQAANILNSQEALYASSVLRWVENVQRLTAEYATIGFRDAVRRLELLSANLE